MDVSIVIIVKSTETTPTNTHWESDDSAYGVELSISAIVEVQSTCARMGRINRIDLQPVPTSYMGQIIYHPDCDAKSYFLRSII